MVGVDEELQAYQEELERQRAQERRRQQQAQALNLAKKSLARKGAATAGRKLVATGARAAVAAIGEAIAAIAAALAPFIVPILLIFGIILFVLIVLTALCNAGGFTGNLAKVGSAAAAPLVGGDYCKILSGSFGGVVNFIDQARTPRFPNRVVDVSRWDSQIRAAATANNLRYCYVRSFVERESGGDPNAIGHDHTAPPPPIKRWQSSNDGKKASEPNNTHDPFNRGSPPKHNLDWGFSHGIGLMQITIFPRTHELGRTGWIDDNTPAREMPPGSGKKYRVLELLDPSLSINAATQYLAQLVRKFNGDYQAAAAAYNGSGPIAQAYGEDIIDRTNLCLSA